MARWRAAPRDPREAPPSQFRRPNGKGNKGGYTGGKGDGQSSRSVICWRCGQEGHASWTCHRPERQPVPTPSVGWAQGRLAAGRGRSPSVEPMEGVASGNAAPAAVSAFNPSPAASVARTGLDGVMPAQNPFGGSPVGIHFPPPPANPPPTEFSAAQTQGSSAPLPNGPQTQVAQSNPFTAPVPALLPPATPPSRTSEVPPGVPSLSSTSSTAGVSTVRTDVGRAPVLTEEERLADERRIEAQYLEVQRDRALRLLEERQKAEKEAGDRDAVQAIEQRLADFKAEHPVAMAAALEKEEVQGIQRVAALMLEAKRTAMNRMVLDISAQIQIQLSMMEVEQAYMRRDYAWQVTAMYDNFALGLLKTGVPPGWKHAWVPVIPEPRVPYALPGEVPQNAGPPPLSTHPAVMFGPKLPDGANPTCPGLGYTHAGTDMGFSSISFQPSHLTLLLAYSFLILSLPLILMG